MSLSNTTVFLSLLGPVLFNNALTRAQNKARSSTNKTTKPHSEAVNLLAETDEGHPAYGLMEFSVHYYTLIASIVALIIASTAIIFVDLPEGWTIEEIKEDSLRIRMMFLALCVYIGGIYVLATGFCGSPRTIETYSLTREERLRFFDQSFSPLNRITVLRCICGAIAALLLYVQIFVYGNLIL